MKSVDIFVKISQGISFGYTWKNDMICTYTVNLLRYHLPQSDHIDFVLWVFNSALLGFPCHQSFNKKHSLVIICGEICQIIR